MTPTPHLPAEDADVAAVREALLSAENDLRWIVGQHQRLKDERLKEVAIEGVQKLMDSRAALDRLAARLQKAERERDELRAWKTATHEQWAAWTRDDFKARAEVAEERVAALREALKHIRDADWKWTTAGAREVARAALATADPGTTE